MITSKRFSFFAKFTLSIFAISCISSCRKEAALPVLTEVHYKIVNNGDASISAFVVWSNTILADGTRMILHDQAFNNVQPFDTLTMITRALPGEPDVNFINASRNFRLRVAFKQKIFSQMHLDNNYLEGGDPYDYGWTQTFNYYQTTRDTVRNPGDKTIYINWPQDSSKLEQVIFF